RWEVIAKGWTRPVVVAAAPDAAVALGGTRSAGAGMGGSGDGGGFTVQLPQIRGTGATRDVVSFLTPPNKSLVLSPRPTFRRLPSDDGYPAAVADLTEVPSKGATVKPQT